MVFGRSRVSGGVAWTIRCDSLKLWRDLVLHGMGEVDFHVFWKYWKLTSSPNTLKLVLGFFWKPGHHLRSYKTNYVSKKWLQTKRKPFYQQITILGGCPGSRFSFFVWVVFRKITWFYSSWDGALAFKKIRGPTWRPEDQFGGIWWWSEFPIFPKNMKIDFPHAM